MKTAPTVIGFDGVSLFSQAKTLILDNITFTLSQGERLAIIGPNGSGKSSLLGTIIREKNHDKGMIHLNGCH